MAKEQFVIDEFAGMNRNLADGLGKFSDSIRNLIFDRLGGFIRYGRRSGTQAGETLYPLVTSGNFTLYRDTPTSSAGARVVLHPGQSQAVTNYNAAKANVSKVNNMPGTVFAYQYNSPGWVTASDNTAELYALPSGGSTTATAAAGGTLPAGDYNFAYVDYVKTEKGFFIVGFQLSGNVTLSGGNGTINFANTRTATSPKPPFTVGIPRLVYLFNTTATGVKLGFCGWIGPSGALSVTKPDEVLPNSDVIVAPHHDVTTFHQSRSYFANPFQGLYAEYSNSSIVYAGPGAQEAELPLAIIGPTGGGKLYQTAASFPGSLPALFPGTLGIGALERSTNAGSTWGAFSTGNESFLTDNSNNTLIRYFKPTSSGICSPVFSYRWTAYELPAPSFVTTLFLKGSADNDQLYVYNSVTGVITYIKDYISTSFDETLNINAEITHILFLHIFVDSCAGANTVLNELQPTISTPSQFDLPPQGSRVYYSEVLTDSLKTLPDGTKEPFAGINLTKTFNYFDIPFYDSSTINALASTPAGLLIFGNSEIFLFRGDPLSNPSLVRFSSTIGCDYGTTIANMGGIVFVIFNGEVYAISLGMGDVDFDKSIEKISLPVTLPNAMITRIAVSPKENFLIAQDERHGIFIYDFFNKQWSESTFSNWSFQYPDFDNAVNYEIMDYSNRNGIYYYNTASSVTTLAQVEPNTNAWITTEDSARLSFRELDFGDKRARKLFRSVEVYTSPEYPNYLERGVTSAASTTSVIVDASGRQAWPLDIFNKTGGVSSESQLTITWGGNTYVRNIVNNTSNSIAISSALPSAPPAGTPFTVGPTTSFPPTMQYSIGGVTGTVTGYNPDNDGRWLFTLPPGLSAPTGSFTFVFPSMSRFDVIEPPIIFNFVPLGRRRI